ncbi:restriction endonuclease subunit S [Streptococcus suis]|uniref:Restriction endonuclease subunit S n=1 Tax=Streptococcus suis TaxID=1307 RepID=A0A9X4MLM8_STRSU|nr:restriction endonuclease subunit S [Streptococcus suis]
MPNKDKNIPKRRFKEFENADAWELRKLGDTVIEIIAGGDIDKNKVVEFGKYPIYANSHSGDGIVGYYDDFYRVNGPAVTVTGRGEVGFAKARETDFTPVVRLLAIRSKHNHCFLENAINLHGVTVESTGVPQLTVPQLSAYRIYFPYDIQEENQIGTFFSTLDQQITLHQRKLDKLKSVKQAYLSEMFPAEGERVPKRRFPGFTDAWELQNVGEICRISTGKSNTQDREEQGKFPFYVRSPIIEKSTKYLFDEEAVLTVGDGVGTGKVFHYVHGKYDLHQRVYRMFSFTHVNAKYFYYYFSKKFFDRVMAMTAKNSVDSVRLEMISDMEITIPQLEEQEKIVKILSTLDQQITLHQRKLEKLKNLKKALLNELFV